MGIIAAIVSADLREHAPVLARDPARDRAGLRQVRLRTIDARRRTVSVQAPVGRRALSAFLGIPPSERDAGSRSEYEQPEVQAADRAVEALAHPRRHVGGTFDRPIDSMTMPSNGVRIAIELVAKTADGAGLARAGEPVTC